MKTKIVLLTALILGFLSCSNSDLPVLDSPAYTTDYSIGIRFVDKEGKDVSDRLDLKLAETLVAGKDEYHRYEMLSEDYTFECFIDGNKVPDIYPWPSEENPLTYQKPVIKLEVWKKNDEDFKTFWFTLHTSYITYANLFIYRKRSHYYEFEYRFLLPTLLQDSEGSLKTYGVLSQIMNRRYDRATFNGDELTGYKSNIFEIVIE